ncbi:MAG: glycosyltransferase [Proteobacteria bacterium]|nr:glycosyltransferase [Pseudomonadota bacterium]
MNAGSAPRIAVLIPCFNEQASVGRVISDFRAALPNAHIYVYDNNSTDETVAAATAAHAIVRRENLQGKGNVTRRMFADVEADVYVMVDGDATYAAAVAPAMVRQLIQDKLDMVVGARIASAQDAYRPGHRTGNRLLSGAVAHFFGKQFSDVLSGYRVFSRRFVKSFPSLSGGFEIETELTVHALELRLPVAEVPTPYVGRVKGSSSKLSTWRDGWRIFQLIVVLYKNERPFRFFSWLSAILGIAALGLGTPLIITFIQTGLVPRMPTAILSTGLVMLSALSFITGLILDTVTRGRREIKRLAYLAIPPP